MGNSSSQMSAEIDPDQLWVAPSQPCSPTQSKKRKHKHKHKHRRRHKYSESDDHEAERPQPIEAGQSSPHEAQSEVNDDLPSPISRATKSRKSSPVDYNRNLGPHMEGEQTVPTSAITHAAETSESTYEPAARFKKGKKVQAKPHFGIPPTSSEQEDMLSLQSPGLLTQPTEADIAFSSMRDEEQAASAGLLALTANENLRAEALNSEQHADFVNAEGASTIDPRMPIHEEGDGNVDPSLETNAMTKTVKPNKRKRQSDQEVVESNKRIQTTAPPAVPVSTHDDYPSQGPFTNVERDAVDLYAKAFIESYQMPRETLNEIVQSKDRKMDDRSRDFWQQIYTLLPNRDNKAMQRHVRRRFHNFTSRGKWTAEEDEMLKQAYDDKPNQWKVIGEELNRMPEDCRDRWRNYVVCGESRKTDHWDDDEEAELGMAVEDCMTQVKNEAKKKALEERLAFREDQDWESQINFNAVSEKLNHQRSRIQCLQHWKAMQERARTGRIKRGSNKAKQLKVKVKQRKSGAGRKPGGGMKKHYMQMEPGDKFSILQELIDTDAYEEEKIPWQLLAQRSPTCRWSIADRRYAFGRMKQLIPEQEDLHQTLEALVRYFEHHHGDRLDAKYDGPPDRPDITSISTPASSKPAKPAKPQTPDQIEADESIDPSLRAINGDAEVGTTPPTSEKKARGRPKKNPDAPSRAKKVGKTFKSNERIEEIEDDAEDQSGQRAAPQANMVGSKASDSAAHPADHVLRRALEQANEDEEPQLPPFRREIEMADESGADTVSPSLSPEPERMQESSEL